MKGLDLGLKTLLFERENHIKLMNSKLVWDSLFIICQFMTIHFPGRQE